jgi:poly-gamma-glutamate synthesis protein (capsule biosynthesis protein)
MKFLGDVYLDKAYKVDIGLDDFIFNLEYPLSCQGTPAKGKVNLCQDFSYIEETFGKFPIAVCLANNHIMDFGVNAYEKTINYLKDNNINYFGAGSEKNNYNNPFIYSLGSNQVAIFGYVCPSTHPSNEEKAGVALMDIKKMEEDISNIKSSVDLIILNLHWGVEEIAYPKYEDRLLAHKLIDLGVDIIIGHHSHMVQSVEKYNGKKIFYGIGNFIFPDINIQSIHDGEKFTGYYKKVQQNRNKTGIAIYLDEELNISTEGIYFDGKKVVTKNVSIPNWLPKSKVSFRKRYKLNTKIRMVQAYIRNPKIPTIEHLRLFLGGK